MPSVFGGPMPQLKVLILGGTTEGRGLATACAELPGIATVSSLAGRTSDPRLPPGPVRIGGFGGVAGLAEYLRSAGIGAVVDATHPFAAQMTSHAVEAAALTSVPFLLLRRPGWNAGPGDRWHRVPSLPEAARILPELGARVFLTIGRQGLLLFAELDECWFLARSVEPPVQPMPQRLEVVLDRGPFTEAGELELLRRHRIEVLVTKDSGGVAPKLTAARELAIPVVMVDRPPPPPAESVPTVTQALTWLATLPPRAAQPGRSWD
jgi:precorrin-6A/cobalt-precorrin-6A reductase